jgi:hypothetical protein
MEMQIVQQSGLGAAASGQPPVGALVLTVDANGNPATWTSPWVVPTTYAASVGLGALLMHFWMRR